MYSKYLGNIRDMYVNYFKIKCITFMHRFKKYKVT